MLCTPLTQRLGLKHPIIQAPMALAAGGKLAAAEIIASMVEQGEKIIRKQQGYIQ